MDKKPIILIPGIQGTKLANVNNVDFKNVYSGFKKYYVHLHNLKLQSDGESDLGAENIIERADVENIAYSEIVDYLRSLGFRVYIFGYDWRKSNVSSAEQLRIFVSKIQDKLNESKINFLTHSMGGLVLSAYLRDLTAEERDKWINRIIFTVPPFLGSVEATYNLVIGKSRLFNSSDDFRKVGITFPGLYELLPVFKDAYKFEDNRTFDIFDFDKYWQQEINNTPPFDERLMKKHNTIRRRLNHLRKIRSDDHYLFNLENMSDEMRSRIIVLAGGGENTQVKIKIRPNYYRFGRHFKYHFDFEAYNDLESEQGDGTVPLVSSTAFKHTIRTFVINTTWLEKRFDSRLIMADWHAFFLNNGRVQNIIKRYFDTDFQAGDYWYQSAGGQVDFI